MIALPALLLANLILRDAVDVPHWDQWVPFSMAWSVHTGQISFHDLFAQHNESRMVFPRLLTLGIDSISRGNVKYEMLAIFVLALAAMWCIQRLARLTLPESSGPRLLVTAAASLLIFSPIQYQNWLWGFQIVIFIPIVCLAAAILVCYSNRSAWAKLWIAIALAIVATYSFANGMILWVLVLPLLLAQFGDRLSKWKAAGVWLLVAAINLAAYFRNYEQPAYHPSFRAALLDPVKTARCFLAMLGAPLGAEDARLADLAGLGTMLVAAAVFLALWRVLSEPGILTRMAGWLILAGYALASAAITTAGRVGITSNYLLDSRYTTFSLYWMVGLMFLAAMLYAEPRRPKWWPVFWVTAIVAAPLFAAAHVVTFRHAVAMMRTTRTERLESRACLTFLDVVDDDCQTRKLYPVSLKTAANTLDQLGYIHPALVRSAALTKMVASADPSTLQYGTFESLTNAGNGFYRASGWAVLPERGEAADAVVVTYQARDGTPAVCGLATDFSPRTDVVSSTGRAQNTNSGWEKIIQLPSDAGRVQAWAYDAIVGRAFLLSRDYRAADVPQLNVRFEGADAGFFDGVTPLGQAFKAVGWAILPEKRRAADMVLLTCGSQNLLVGAAVTGIERPDVAIGLKQPGFRNAGWNAVVEPSKLPTGGCEVKAWAYDRETGLARQLSGVHAMGAAAK